MGYLLSVMGLGCFAAFFYSVLQLTHMPCLRYDISENVSVLFPERRNNRSVGNKNCNCVVVTLECSECAETDANLSKT